MKILALDTSTEACSAALYCDGEITHRDEIAPQQHGQYILSMVENLLADAQLTLTHLDALAWGRGPGSFTGIRIAAGVVQGLAFAHDTPVISISTLQALAQQAYRTLQANEVISAIDARMGEVYWSAYRVDNNKLMQAIHEEAVAAPEKIYLSNNQFNHHWIGVGTGCLTYKTVLQKSCPDLHIHATTLYPHAHDIVQLATVAFQAGEGVSAELALPVYLRDTVTKESNK